MVLSLVAVAGEVYEAAMVMARHLDNVLLVPMARAAAFTGLALVGTRAGRSSAAGGLWPSSA